MLKLFCSMKGKTVEIIDHLKNLMLCWATSKMEIEGLKAICTFYLPSW